VLLLTKNRGIENVYVETVLKFSTDGDLLWKKEYDAEKMPALPSSSTGKNVVKFLRQFSANSTSRSIKPATLQYSLIFMETIKKASILFLSLHRLITIKVLQEWQKYLL
jgi:hypothetical protein